MKARAFHAPVAMVLAGLWGAALAWGNVPAGIRLLDRFEAAMTDLRMLARGTRPAPDAVTIVAIDDQVVREQGSYPLPRAALARIIEQIAQLKPKVIAVDMLLVDRSTPDDDAALARALGKTNAVIAAAAIFAQARQRLAADGDGPLAQIPTAERFLLPLKEFTEQAGIGVVNVTTDQTGVPRSMPLLFRTADAVLVSLPLRTAAAAASQDPSIAPNDFVLSGPDVPTDVGHLLPISFYGPHGTIRTVSASAALDGTLAHRDIEDRAVVIGVTVTGGGDFFPTPFDPVMPGVEVVATAITHLLAKDALVRNHAVRLADGAVAVLLPMLLVGLLAWRRNSVGLLAIAAVAAIWSTVNVAAFMHGIWLSAALPIAAAAPPTILFGAVQIWTGRRRAQHFAERSDLLQQFQAPRLHAWLTKDPDFLLQPVHQDAAVVFIDLSGFTAHSEAAGPNATRELLNDFQGIIDREAEARGGLITSFMGDGAMLLFGLPQATDDDAANAVNCCLGLSVGTRAWLDSLPPQIGSRMGFKIGAHFGAIVASRLGGSHQHITAIGDTVNVASRMMEVAKSHGAEIALTDDLLREAGRNSPGLLGALTGPEDVQIRGRAGSINAWLWRRGAPMQ
jgi:adenylate cyclase